MSLTEREIEPVSVVEFMRTVCLRMVVSELTQAQYRHELDNVSPSVGSDEDGWALKQSAEFLRRTGKAAKRSLDEAFKMAEDHLASQQMLACVGEVAKRLAGSIGGQVNRIASSLEAARSNLSPREKEASLEEAAEAAQEAGRLLDELICVGMGDREKSTVASLRQILEESLILWGEEGESDRTVQGLDPGLTLKCRPYRLKVAFLNILQEIFKGGQKARRPQIRCRQLPREVWVEFLQDKEANVSEQLPFSLDIARRIIASHQGRLALEETSESRSRVYRVVLPICDLDLR